MRYWIVNTENLAILTPLPSDIKLGNHPSWNIPHIPRAGAASGLHRPSGCVGYFTRDDFLVWYREISHSAAPRAIFLDIELYFWIVFLDCIFGSAYGLSKNTVQKYNPKIQSNIDGNGVNIARFSILTIQYSIVLFYRIRICCLDK